MTCPYSVGVPHQVRIYRCFSCMKVSALDPNAPPRACPHCQTLIRSNAPLPLGPLPPLPAHLRMPVRAPRLLARRARLNLRVGIAAAAVAPRTVFIPANLTATITESIAMRILVDNTVREQWLEGGSRGHAPMPTDGLGLTEDAWTTRIAVLTENQTLFMDTRVIRTEGGSKMI